MYEEDKRRILSMRKICSIVLAIVVMIGSLSGCSLNTKTAYGGDAVFEDWNQEAPALLTLQEYVESVTDEKWTEHLLPSFIRPILSVIYMNGVC